MRGPTNTAVLDDGTFGRNLQIGSDKTHCPVSDPGILLFGDGGLSSYDWFLNGSKQGTASSDGFANVNCQVPQPLEDGHYEFTANELKPNPSKPVTPFDFVVDTKIPDAPSAPEISSYSDSGVPGDHITQYRNVNFHGSGTPGFAVQLKAGPSIVAGAKIDANGAWSATTTSLADGRYDIYAVQISLSGNVSPPSDVFELTVKQPGEAGVPAAPTMDAPKPLYYNIVWTPGADGGAAITGYNIYRGDTPTTLQLIASIGAAPFFADFSAQIGKTYYYAATALNSAGESPKPTPIRVN